MHLSELKAMHIGALITMGEALEIDNVARLRKQELMFAIMKKRAKGGEQVFGDGVLEVLPDGWPGLLQVRLVLADPGNQCARGMRALAGSRPSGRRETVGAWDESPKPRAGTRRTAAELRARGRYLDSVRAPWLVGAGRRFLHRSGPIIGGGGGRPSTARRRTPGGGRHQARWPSRNAVSCDLDSAPTLVAASWPSLNSIRVGMPRMPNLAGTSRLSSTFILAICRRGP